MRFATTGGGDRAAADPRSSRELRRRRAQRAMSLAALLTVALCLPVGAPRAQQPLPLKRTFVGPLPSACGVRRVSAAATPLSATPANVEESRRLFALGQEASIVGDHRTARDLFLQAGKLNAADERVPYYLGRSLEELRQVPDAVAQYCRYLTLAPTGFDADDVRGRLDRLSTDGATSGGSSGRAAAAAPSAVSAAAGRRTVAGTRFRAAVEAADKGRGTEAERGFSDVISQVPNAAEAYYDRGVLRATRRDFGGAASDFDRYLALRPDAEDAPAVRERLSLLRRASISPATAFAGGVVLPGFGQFYTGRPLFGVAVAAGVGGGIYYALAKTSQERSTTYPKPFGGTYTVIDTIQVRKHTTVGAAIAGGVALLGAIESYGYAQGRRSDAARFADGRAADGVANGDGSAFALAAAPTTMPDELGKPVAALSLVARLRF